MSYEDDDIKSGYDFRDGPTPATIASSSNADVPEPTTPRDVEGERRVRREIEDAAPRNTALLNDLMSTEEDVQVLQNNENRLRIANRELAAQDRAVQDALATSTSQFRRYTRDRDSLARKWYYILTRMRDKFEVKVKEAERQYHEALAVQSQTENRQSELQQDMDEIKKANSGLEARVKKHGEAHEEIDKLYSFIFDGQTPGFPDEDEREATHKARRDEHDATTMTLKIVTKASKEVKMLETAINKAQSENERAKYEVESSFFSLDYGLLHLDRCARMIDKAMKLDQDSLEGLPKPWDRNLHEAHQALARSLSSAKKDAISAVNSPFLTSGELFNAIQRIDDDLNLARDAQEVLAKVVRRDEATAMRAVRLTARSLENSRQALQEIRQGAFEITVGFGAAAPPYHECCDRTEGYCTDALGQVEQIVISAVHDSGLPPPPSYERAVE